MADIKKDKTLAYESKLEPVDIENRTITATITTDDVNRYDSIVVTKGIYRANYEKNPIVLFNHDLDKPVGTNNWIVDKGIALLAQTRFGKHRLGEEVFNLYKDDIMRAFSIKISYYLKDANENEDKIWIINKSELEEYSTVTVPANMNALRLAYTGLKSPELKSAFKLIIDEDKLLTEHKELQANYDELKLKLDTMDSSMVKLLQDMEKINTEVQLINQDKKSKRLQEQKAKQFENQILQKLLN